MNLKNVTEKKRKDNRENAGIWSEHRGKVFEVDPVTPPF